MLFLNLFTTNKPKAHLIHNLNLFKENSPIQQKARISPGPLAIANLQGIILKNMLVYTFKIMDNPYFRQVKFILIKIWFFMLTVLQK
jgi:hypothetical protein